MAYSFSGVASARNGPLSLFWCPVVANQYAVEPFQENSFRLFSDWMISMDRRNVGRSTSTCTLEQEDAEHWIYRGEGACTGLHWIISFFFRLQRPAWRVEAAEVNVLCGSAIFMSDHSVVPRGKLQGEHCICVELKILDISEYDPLDLFSQSKERIHKAIRALFDTPQNNLRVFLDGSQIFGGLGGSADTSYSESREAFERALIPIIDAEVGQLTSRFIELIAETVSRSQVLDLLLEVQKLDMFDIERAIHAYYDVVSRSCLVCKDMGSEQPSDIYDALHSIPLDESLKIARNYLICCRGTAKDCSLMITLRPREDGNGGSPRSYVYLDSTNQSFDYKANFIDLDMKPLKKMEHYYELDQRIVRRYTRKA